MPIGGEPESLGVHVPNDAVVEAEELVKTVFRCITNQVDSAL